jgi:hypothetical protein
LTKGPTGYKFQLNFFFSIFLSTLNSAMVLEQGCGGGTWDAGGGSASALFDMKDVREKSEKGRIHRTV